MEVGSIEETNEASANLTKKIKEIEKAIDEHKRRENLFLQDKETSKALSIWKNR